MGAKKLDWYKMVEDYIDMVTVEDNGCWTLPYRSSTSGSPQISIDGKSRVANHVFYEHFKRGEPKGPNGWLSHTCGNRACVNPEHIVPFKPKDRPVKKPRLKLEDKETCYHGHPITAENLVIWSSGKRACRECNRAAARKHYRKTHPIKPV